MMRFRFLFITTAIVCLVTGCRSFTSGSGPAVPDPGLARGIDVADSLIDASVGKLIPGAVFLVSREGRVVHERAFGYAQLNDYQGRRLATPTTMRTSTMFDLASVTKVLATTMAGMLLVDPGLTRGIEVADSLIDASVGKLIPGAVFLVSREGRVVHERAFGYAQLNDYQGRRLATPTTMRTSTMFDLASVTKVLATTMAAMLLVDRGQLNLDAPVYRYLPDFRGPHLDSITVRQLLQHSAGLVQWQPLYYSASNTTQTYAVIRDMPLGWGVGEARHYSDLGFMLLGDIVERVSGQRLGTFLEQNLYRPLGLGSTTFNPKARGFTEFAATEQGNVYEKHMVYDSTFGYRYRGDPTAWNGWRQYVLNGEVDDGNSYYANGGIAGHAGLFSTAADARVLLDLLNNGGAYEGRRYLRPLTIGLFLTLDKYQNYLGWQAPTYLPGGSFSHTGFTGTYVAGIPKYGLSIVLLTNRQNMGTDARGYFPDIGPLQQAVARAVVAGAAGQ